MAEQFKTFAPHYNVADTSKPFGISSSIGLLSSVSSIASNYLDTKTPTNEIDTINVNLKRVKVS